MMSRTIQEAVRRSVKLVASFTHCGIDSRMWHKKHKKHKPKITTFSSRLLRPRLLNSFCGVYFMAESHMVVSIKKLVAEERTTTVSSLHFLYVNSKLGRQHTRRRWQPLPVHL